MFFITQFITGLKEEVRSVISLHRPKDVVMASTLALSVYAIRRVESQEGKTQQLKVQQAQPSSAW